MRRLLTLFGLILFGSLFVSVVTAQPGDTCPDTLQETLDTVAEACAELGRNQVCYGNNTIFPSFRDEAESIEFESAGDVADLTDLASLQLSPMDEEVEEWGVAMLSAQANLPDTLPGQAIIFLLFGDVEIGANPLGGEAEAEDAANLDKMQAFYFSSGIGDRACAEAPDSGILMQTAEGVASVDLTINGVDIALGSTLYVQAEAEGDMTLSVVEGSADITAEGTTVTAEAGTFVTVPMTEDLTPDGAPSEPAPYDAAALGTLPIVLLPRGIAIAPALEGDTETEASGEEFELEVGTWVPRYDLENPLFNNCGIAAIGSFPLETVELTSPSALDLIQLSLGELESGGITIEVTNPEPNYYVLTGSQSGFTMTFEYRIISPTRVEQLSNTPSGTDSCRIIIPIIAEHQGE